MQELEAGQKFERYRVLHFLGSGISGESYEVEDTLLQRTVLLKLIHPWLALSDAIRRQFFRDMQHISSVTHPYLTAILDYGEVDSQLYMVRRFVGPGSLLNREGRTWFNPPLTPVDAITHIHQLALALHHLHSQGLTHGSLAFSNIMVSCSPAQSQELDAAPLLLADTGVAAFVRRLGLPKITFLPITAAPEHLEKHIVPAGDQYALAVLLYFWLAGRPPFLGSPDMLMQQKLTETITPLTLFNPRVSARQEAIILRALCCLPEKRFPSVLAFAEALTEALHQPAHTILPDETPSPQLFRTSTYTTDSSATSSNEATHTTSIEQHTEELFPLPPELQERATQSLVSHVEKEAIAGPDQDEEKPAPSDFESLLASLLQSNQASSTPSSPYQTTDETGNRDSRLTTEPMHNGQSTEQGYLAGLFNTEANATWNNIVLQEQPGPAIPQSLPEPMQPDEVQEPDGQKSLPSLMITSHYLTEPREVALENELITVGRAGSSDILLDHDNLTSRHHAILKYDRDQYVIFDQRSAKGILVNGQRLTVGVGWRLTDGDCIVIGAYTLIFHSGPSQDSSVPSER